MKREKWALAILGAWVAGSLCMMVVATQNFRTIDRLLATSDHAVFRSMVEELGSARARDLLRYLSSELNRLYFQGWSVLQLALGGAVLWLTANRPDARRMRLLVGALLVTVLVMAVWLTPEITTLGRRLDFMPRDPPPPGVQRFWMLHGVYTTLEIGKLVVALLVARSLAATPEARQPLPRGGAST